MIEIDGEACEEVQTLRPGFAIVKYRGECIFAAWVDENHWEPWAGSPSPEDKVALIAAIEANGGFDKTSVDVIPPSGAP